MVTTEPRFKIGQKFKTLGKHPRICTITDIHRTYNSANELVNLRYVATHSFMGQTLTEAVVETTVARGFIGELDAHRSGNDTS